MVATLFIVPTPIGNLKDISFRALETLKAVEVIAAEDTRRTKALLSHFDIHKKVVSYHQHNEEKRASELIDILKEGKDIALVTDAGTPGVSDPGRVLVEKAFINEIKVCPIPGPSAVTTALSACPFLYDGYLFYGFLPSKKGERLRELEKLKDRREVIVFFLTPHKIKDTLRELCNFFKGRRALLAKELTKIHETIIVDEICSLLEKIEGFSKVKGEYTLLIEGNRNTRETDKEFKGEHIDLLIDTLFKKGLTSKDIVEVLTKVFSLKKKVSYELVNRFKEDER